LKRVAATLVVLAVAVGVLYYLGIGPPFGLGPFEIGAAKSKPEQGNTGQRGQGQRRRGGRAVTIKAAAVRVGDVEARLSYVGSLAPNAAVTVAPKTSGRVARLFVTVGERVKEGQLLGQLAKDELAEELREAQASLRVAQATHKGRRAELENLKRRRQNVKVLAGKQLVSREEVNNLETQVLSAESQVDLTKAQMLQMQARLDNARIRLAHTEVRSPFAGHVSRRMVDRGALVSASTPLFEVVDIDRVKVGIDVVEGDYRKVSLGQPVAVKVDAYPDKRFNGTITRMSPVLDPATRTAEAEIELDNPDGLLKPGMFARTTIVVERKRGVLMVPEASPVKTSAGYGVFRLTEEGNKVERVEVTPGLSNGGWVEVTGDLRTGDRVVTLGSSLVRHGQRIRVAGDGPRAGSRRGRRMSGREGRGQGEGRRRGQARVQGQEQGQTREQGPARGQGQGRRGS